MFTVSYVYNLVLCTIQEQMWHGVGCSLTGINLDEDLVRSCSFSTTLFCALGSRDTRLSIGAFATSAREPFLPALSKQCKDEVSAARQIDTQSLCSYFGQEIIIGQQCEFL